MSWLLLDEAFEAGEERFLSELLAQDAEKKLKGFGERWIRDARPFARAMLLRYIDDGCDRPHHRPLVKKLFKCAEDAQDDELIAHFMVAFDRLLPRTIFQSSRYNRATQEVEPHFLLVPAGDLPKTRGAAERASRFSRATRGYLARRALRYFRKIGRKDHERYFRGVHIALRLYQDKDLSKAENLLDAWGLIHVLYWGSPVLERHRLGVRLRPERALAELAPAPLCPKAWDDRQHELFDLFENAGAKTVRAFALSMLKERHSAALDALELSALLRLLASPHDDLQLFAAQRLRERPGLETLPLADWLRLLELTDPNVIALITELVKKHVSPERLSLAECVRLARAPIGPVAELGLSWVQQKKVQTPEALGALLPLAEAKAPLVRERAVAHLLEQLERSSHTRPEHLRDVIDAKFVDARTPALALLSKDQRFATSTVLWAALAESPYEEVRSFFSARFAAAEVELDATELVRVFASALLSVSTGSKVKPKVLRAIVERLSAHPAETEALLPLLRISLRSVRAAERREALSALARAALARPELRAVISREIPELSLGPEESVCR